MHGETVPYITTIPMPAQEHLSVEVAVPALLPTMRFGGSLDPTVSLSLEQGTKLVWGLMERGSEDHA